MVHQYIIYVSHKLRCYTSNIGPKFEVDTFNMRHENEKKHQEDSSPKLQTMRQGNENENALSLRMNGTLKV